MNPVGSVSRLFFFGAALLASAQAQLVHIALTEGENNGMIFRATSAQIPWNHTGGYISRFDLWYDVAAPSDPTRNLWRARVHAYGLGTFEIVRPVENLWFSESNLTLSHWPETGPYESVDLTAIVSDPTPDPGLPVPPFTLSQLSLSFAGGRSFFDVPDLAEGYGYGAFNRATARVVDSVDLHPVPEPSTYSLGAVALLGAAAILRRHRTRGGRQRCGASPDAPRDR